MNSELAWLLGRVGRSLDIIDGLLARKVKPVILIHGMLHKQGAEVTRDGEIIGVIHYDGRTYEYVENGGFFILGMPDASLLVGMLGEHYGREVRYKVKWATGPCDCKVCRRAA